MAAFWNDWRKGRGIIFIFAGLVVYLLLVRILGFYIDTFLLMTFLLKMFGEKGYKRPLLISLLTVGGHLSSLSQAALYPVPAGASGNLRGWLSGRKGFHCLRDNDLAKKGLN